MVLATALSRSDDSSLSLHSSQVVLNFFTGYHTFDGQLIMKFDMISRKYVRGWFWVDSISSIPIDTIALMSKGIDDIP